MAEPAAPRRRSPLSFTRRPRRTGHTNGTGRPGPLRGLRPRTVRARATAGAVAVVAAALTIASFVLLGLIENHLVRNAEDEAVQQAQTVARLAATGNLDRARPPVHGVDFIQVVTADGRVLLASPDRAGIPPISAAEPAVPGRRLRSWNVRPAGDEHRQRIVQVTAESPDGPLTVYAGTSLRDVDAAEDTTRAALAFGVPLLLATVALVTWRVTGRALEPVEAIRAEMAAITDRDLHRRVPVPDTHDEIARLAQTMNATLDRLESSGIRQRRFIADASHELRSPITVLRTQLEVALAVHDPELWPELIGGALQDIERLQQLAADLLLLARIDAAQPVAAVPLELTGLIEGAVGARLGDRVPVRTRLAPEVPVNGSELWLTRVVTNLLDNAERFADRDVQVTLRTSGGPRERAAVLEVTDDGPGIAPGDRERIFERFTRLDDARSRDHGGAGLGLAIARDLTTHHGGTLTAEDSPRGARFVVRLPMAPPVV